MKHAKAFVILILIILCSTGCVTKERIDINYNVPEIPNNDFMITVNNYFQHSDDIRKWRNYTTETYVKRVYSWCTGDYTEEATVGEMVRIYYQLNKDSLRLKSVDINHIEIDDNDGILLETSRTWEDGQKDETTYSILFENGEWKIDDRM